MGNEALFNGLLGVIQQPVFAKDKNFVYTFCNQSFADYLGKTKQEIIGSTVFQLFHPERAKIYHQADQKLFESGGADQYEINMSMPDGAEHYSKVYLNVITDNDGSKLGIIGLIEDISKLKEKEKELNLTENRYKKIFENVQDIFYQIDLNGKIMEISPSVIKYSDYTREEIIGQSIDLFYDNPEDRNLLLKEIQEKGEVWDFEIRLKGKKNQISYASVNAHFIINEKGQISGVEGVLRDLTERKRADEKLKLAISSLQATLESTADGILVVDYLGKITNYNKQFISIFDVPLEKLEAGNDTAALEAVLNLFKSPEQFISKVHFLYVHPDQESFDTLEFKDGRIIERYSRPQLLEGRPIGRVWSFSDVTEQKQAEQQLNLMANALKCINECISITDTSDLILFVNEAFQKTYGYSAEELSGKTISIVRSPANDPRIEKEILDLTNDSGWKGELINQRKDGSDFPISLSTTIVKDDKGEILGLVGVASDITERKMTELELKENEERYRSLFEGLPDAIFLADIETGIIVGANQASTELMKMPLNKIIGIPQYNLHPKGIEKDSKIVFLQHVKTIRQKKNFKIHESMVQCADGSQIPVEIMASIVHLKGKPVLQGVFRNISERKAAEKAILESEKRFRLLIENQSEGITIVDKNENFTFVNPAAEIIFGVSPGKLLNHNLFEFMDPNEHDKILQESAKRGKNEKSTYEVDIVTPTGIRKNIHVIAAPQNDENGKFTGTIGVIRDITATKQAEEMLRLSEQKYRDLIETMPDGVYRSTPEGRFVEVNPAMVKMLGYESKQELLNIDIKTQLYFNPEDRESLVLELSPEDLDVYPLKKKDGTAIWMEDHGWYVKDENGKIIFHEGILRDVTDRKMDEQQLQKYSGELQELNATKDKFFSIIAHDLKSPFTSISGLSEILKEEARHLDIATIEQYSGIINFTAKSTYQLLENLLDWALVQQSHIQYQPGSIILRQIVNEILELMTEKANTKEITTLNL